MNFQRLHRFDLTLTDDECRDLIDAIDADVKPCGAHHANKQARFVLSVHPRHDVDDPEAYISAITMIMEDYPKGVIDRVTHPKTGVIRKIKFLPRPAEMADACDEEMKRREKLRKNAELIIWRHNYEATQANGKGA